jgi:hypothetical protein
MFFVLRTKFGMAMRALSKDIETTGLMGVNTDRVITISFAIGSALAAAGGILWAIKFPQINPLMGVMPGLKAFIAAVLGGIGNLTGRGDRRVRAGRGRDPDRGFFPPACRLPRRLRLYHPDPAAALQANRDHG